jgi:hypothetical protein
MGLGHQGRHRSSGDGHEGRHRDPDEDRHEEQREGRHRAVAVQRAAIPPLLTASGAVAAAALTALVLSGQQESLGHLFADRQQEPRPSATSPNARGGAPTDADIALVAAGSSPGFGGMGNSLGGSVWDVLFQQDPGGSSSVLALLCDGRPGGTARTAVAGAGGWGSGGPTMTSAWMPFSSAWTSTAFSPASGADGSSGPGTQPAAPAVGTDPLSVPPPGGSSDGGGSAVPVPVPGRDAAEPVVAPVTTVAEPVTGAAEPVVAPVTKVAEPVTRAAEPVVAPVTKVAEPVVEKAEPVVEKAEPVVAPVTKVAEPVVEKAEPVVEKAEPVVEEAEPVVEEAEPVVEEAEPVVEKAEPVVEEASREVERASESLPSTDEGSVKLPG